MVKHVIVWTLKSDYSDEEKAQIKKGIKEGLEGLKDKVPGIVEIKVYTDGLASSNADLILDSAFTDEAALAGYALCPIRQNRSLWSCPGCAYALHSRSGMSVYRPSLSLC